MPIYLLIAMLALPLAVSPPSSAPASSFDPVNPVCELSVRVFVDEQPVPSGGAGLVVVRIQNLAAKAVWVADSATVAAMEPQQAAPSSGRDAEQIAALRHAAIPEAFREGSPVLPSPRAYVRVTVGSGDPRNCRSTIYAPAFGGSLGYTKLEPNASKLMMVTIPPGAIRTGTHTATAALACEGAVFASNPVKVIGK